MNTSVVHIPELGRLVIQKKNEVSTMIELTMDDIKRFEGGKNKGYNTLTNILQNFTKQSMPTNEQLEQL